jgi:hypothetical protein
MRRSTSSNGPGIGVRPKAASQRSGLGMRVSVAATFTARNVLLKVFRTAPSLMRELCLPVKTAPNDTARSTYSRGFRQGTNGDNNLRLDRGPRRAFEPTYFL